MPLSQFAPLSLGSSSMLAAFVFKICTDWTSCECLTRAALVLLGHLCVRRADENLLITVCVTSVGAFNLPLCVCASSFCTPVYCYVSDEILDLHAAAFLQSVLSRARRERWKCVCLRRFAFLFPLVRCVGREDLQKDVPRSQGQACRRHSSSRHSTYCRGLCTRTSKAWVELQGR